MLGGLNSEVQYRCRSPWFIPLSQTLLRREQATADEDGY